MTKQFKRLVRRSGIRYCTLRDLRRAFVSHRAMAAINEAVAQQLAGHASFKRAGRRDTRILPEPLRRATSRLPSANAG